MSKTIRIVGYTLATIVVFVIVAALALPYIVNPNDHKAEIAELVHNATGRKLTIAGNIRLSVFPWLGIRIDDVSLGNAPGFGTTPFVSIKEADVSVRLLPLVMHQRMQIGTVRLQGLQVHLARNKQGVFNWSDLLGKGSGAGGTPAKSGGATSLAGLMLGGLHIDDATLTWADAVTGTHDSVTKVRLNTGAVRLGQPFALKLDFDVSADSPPTHGHIRLSTKVTADPGHDDYRLDHLKTDFDITEGKPALKLEGTLSTSVTAHPDIGRYQLETGRLAVTPSGAALPLNAGHLTVNWQPLNANLKPLSVSVPSVTVNGLGLAATVNARTVQLAGNARIKGHLSLSAASLAPFLQALGSKSAAKLQSIGKISAHGDFSYDPKAGLARLDSFTLTALGTQVLASATAGELASAPQISASITMPVVAASSLLPKLEGLLPANMNAAAAGKIGLASQFTVDLEQASLDVNKLTLTVAGTRLTVTGQAKHLFSEPVFDGRIHMRDASPRRLLEILAVPVTTADPHALSRLSISSRVNAGTDSVALSRLDIHLDDTHLRGQLGINHFSGPAVDFDLAVDRIDVDRYLPPAAQRKSPGHEQSGAIGSIVLPFDLLNGLDVNGKLTIGRMRAFSIRSSNDRLGIQLANGKLRAYPLRANLYGGTYSGDVNIDAAARIPGLSMNETVSHIGVGKLIKDLTGIAHLSGTGDVHVRLTGRGRTLGEIRKTLTGDVSFSLKDGAIDGVNLWAAIRTARALLKHESPPAYTGPPRTEFTELSGTGKIRNGVLDNRDLLLELPFLRITGAGKLDLAKQTIHYDTSARVIGTPQFANSGNLSDLKGADIPLIIGGTFTKPTVVPNLKVVLEEHFRKMAEQKLKQVENKLKSKVTDALKNLFGGGN